MNRSRNASQRPHRSAAARQDVPPNPVDDAFVATLVHEIRTPLNAILGWTQILMSGRLDDHAARRALEAIDRNAHAQARLITDVLDLMRSTSGKLRLRRTDVDVKAVLHDVVEASRPTASARGVRLTTVFNAAGAAVRGDPDRLRQVFSNLITNALQFTLQGGRVTVRLLRGPCICRVSVRDTGIGIDPDLLPHVFERFRQGNVAAVHHGRGLGLGLALARHLTELHGGRIEAFSQGTGRGSRFTVTLPLARCKEGSGLKA